VYHLTKDIFDEMVRTGYYRGYGAGFITKRCKNVEEAEEELTMRWFIEFLDK